MGPCTVCGEPGSFGAPHPEKKVAVWACAAHKAALPKRKDRNYARTEEQDREAAMRAAATKLVELTSMEQVKEIGRERFQAAFEHGLEAYFAMRAEQLEP